MRRVELGAMTRTHEDPVRAVITHEAAGMGAGPAICHNLISAQPDEHGGAHSAVKPIASPIGSWSSVVIVRPDTGGAPPVPPVDGVDGPVGPEGFVLGCGAEASVSTDGPENALDAVAMTSVSPPTTAPRRNWRRST